MKTDLGEHGTLNTDLLGHRPGVNAKKGGNIMLLEPRGQRFDRPPVAEGLVGAAHNKPADLDLGWLEEQGQPVFVHFFVWEDSVVADQGVG